MMFRERQLQAMKDVEHAMRDSQEKSAGWLAGWLAGQDSQGRKATTMFQQARWATDLDLDETERCFLGNGACGLHVIGVSQWQAVRDLRLTILTPKTRKQRFSSSPPISPPPPVLSFPSTTMDLSPELTSKRTSEDVATEPQPAIAGTQDIAIVDTVLPPPKRVRFNSHDQVRTFLAEPFYPRSSIAGIADGIIASTLVPNGIGEDHDATDGPTNTNATSILIDINNSPFPITTSPTDLSPLFAQPPLLPLTATTIDSISPTLLMTNPLVNSASSASTPQDPDSATATATDRDDPAPGNIDAQAAGLLSQPAGESDPLDRLFLDDSYDEEADEDWKEEDAESSSSSSSSNEISEEERRRREEGYEDEGADEEEEEEEGDGEDVDVVDWDMDDTEWFTGKERGECDGPSRVVLSYPLSAFGVDLGVRGKKWSLVFSVPI